ncbi:hypothetical protein H4F99_08465 [Lysobacter sp. SG-8]|uniref:Uncharacterized protein n=1 Tax=Marilutibacter penaei TaxID=2759900 RepID=A0A7W3U3Y7_9GAMM|nr:hypothetical protein [Lysobacter penaei]MBB1088519.1 hypothetical protein [Lysobacter penaei]
MSHDTDFPTEHDDRLPDGMRWQLRALRNERMPGRDLWPDIAGRLPPRLDATAESARPVSLSHHHRPTWLAPAALAASLLLVAIAIGWHMPGGQAVETRVALSTPDIKAVDTGYPYRREADGLTLQYQAAFSEIDALPGDSSLQPVISELDRNADLILDALAQQPDSRLLLDQLRRTYAQRLALSQRMLNT